MEEPLFVGLFSEAILGFLMRLSSPELVAALLVVPE
jgi:hypothetical protein